MGPTRDLPPSPQLNTETDSVSETSCFSYLEFRTMYKVQKPSDSEYKYFNPAENMARTFY
jgi:hypothetical protein